MKATELRIGNVIMDYEEIITVDGIDDIDVFNKNIGDIPLHTINPVQITEEWLLKFGFEKTYESQFRLKYDHPRNYIGYDFSKTEEKSMEDFRFYGHYIKIKYVHQLQNLYFALTGEELHYTL